MKASELRELAAREIRDKIGGYEEELFNLRFQARMGQLSNPVQLRMLRKEIARAHTVLTEKLREAPAAAKKAEAPAAAPARPRRASTAAKSRAGARAKTGSKTGTRAATKTKAKA